MQNHISFFDFLLPHILTNFYVYTEEHEFSLNLLHITQTCPLLAPANANQTLEVKFCIRYVHKNWEKKKLSEVDQTLTNIPDIHYFDKLILNYELNTINILG